MAWAGNNLRRTCDRILSEIAASDFRAFIASQIAGQAIDVTKAGDISAQILEADCALSCKGPRIP